MFCIQSLKSFIEFIQKNFGLYYFQDFLEILIFSIITYKCLIWLKQDNTKNLLLGSYLYISLIIFSHLTSCNILFTTLLITAPIVILFIIVIHQKQLQKNFVLSSKTNLIISSEKQTNWLETFIQSCLIASHNKKNITCIIELSQNLQTLLKTDFILNIPIQHEFINIILSSNKITDKSIFWINQAGTIYSANVSWSNLLLNELIIKPNNNFTLSYEAAMLLTQKTDALIFSINAHSDTHTIWYKGNCIKQATIQQLLKFIHKVIDTQLNQSIILKRRINNDSRDNITQ